MESIFGVPAASIAWVVGASWLLAALGIVGLGLRNRVLVRLALRHIPRRRAQTALVVVGLMLSTTIVTTALGTGDTMSHAIRTVVTASLGRTDELIVPNEGYGWRGGRRALEGLRRGDVLAAAADSSFPYAEYERIAGAVRDTPEIAAVTPAVIELRTVVNTRSRLSVPDVKLLAVPARYPTVFGVPEGPDGPARLTDLRPGEAYLNAEAAAALQAAAGDTVEVRDDAFRAFKPWRLQVRALVRAPGLAGTQPTLLVPLAHAWEDDPSGDGPGYINAILVANRGDDESSVDGSAAATRALRTAIADPDVAAELHAVMAAPEFRRELDRFVADFETDAGINDDEELRLLRAFQTELSRSRATPEFISLTGDPELVSELGDFAQEAWMLDGISEAGSLLGQLHPLSVRELKRVGLERADLAGSVLTSIFGVLGLFSIAVGTLLVFLIWVMLAAERRSEMGAARAVGVHRHHLVQMFLFEGALYSLLASAAGVLAGLLVGRLATTLLADIVRRFGVEIETYFAPRSLLIAFCLGGLLTFAIVAYCSWRISRLNIVAAIRDLPDSALAPRRLAGLPARLRPAPVRAGLLALVGGALLALAVRLEQLGLWGLGLSVLVFGGAVAARWWLARSGLPGADRLVWSAVGLWLLWYWGRPLTTIASGRDFPTAGHVEVFVLGGVLMVLGAVWVTVYNLVTPLRGLELILARLPRAAAVLRTAVAYPLSARLRTGIVLAMFALVVFTMVVGSVLTRTAGTAYADTGAITGGFELSAVSSEPIPDVRRALRSASAIRPDAFAAAGSSAQLRIESLRLDAPVTRWTPAGLTVVDDGWLAGSGYTLAARAPEYATDAEAWAALRERPGLALAIPDAGSDGLGFRVGGAFSPTAAWVRDLRGGRSVPVTVIGLLDPRVPLPEGLLASARTLAGRFLPVEWDSYAFKLAPGQDARRAALGLELSFTEQQLSVDLSGEQALQREAVRILLNYLLTGFMGLGLIVGIAALGVIALRAVVERRRQIATLRAIGFRAGAVLLGLLIEASIVAALGILIGVLLGLLVSRNIVGHLALDYPELIWTVPWRQVLLLAAFAGVCVLLTTALPAWQASRIPPAEGVRVE